jgi:hypothetical protein
VITAPLPITPPHIAQYVAKHWHGYHGACYPKGDDPVTLHLASGDSIVVFGIFDKDWHNLSGTRMMQDDADGPVTIVTDEPAVHGLVCAGITHNDTTVEELH